MSKQRNRDISLYDGYYTSCYKPIKKKCPKKCTPKYTDDNLCNIRELRNNHCYQDPCYLKCSKYNKCCQCTACNNKYNACYQKCQNKCKEVWRSYGPYTTCNTYRDNTCNCKKCNNNYNACNKYNNINTNNYSTCNNGLISNAAIRPLQPCLFATTGVVYPLVNNDVHRCQFP